MALSLVALSVGHVPTYPGAGLENCFKPPHTHTTSQVIYLKGSGGLEIHVESDSVPFDTANAEMIDFDLVLRDEIDQSTYDVYVGCGGCVASEDPLVPASKRTLNGYEPADVEPFTQTVYRSVFPVADRKFDSSLLTALNCPQAHFTVRLVDHGGREDGKPIVWGAVVGLGETFTLTELLSFPLYVLYNHGDTWNQIPYTSWLWCFVFAPLLLAYIRDVMRAWGVDVLDASPVQYV